ncbi:MAG: WYL domain-containing protein, partial [Actinomycetota bacterium]
ANKLERVLNLTAVLLDTPRPLTAEELREKVEGYPPPGAAFHRAFERDKDDLRQLGIPLTVERAPATNPPVDGYRIDPADYYLADPGLEPDELAAVHLASLTVRLDGAGNREALWKLGGVDDAPELAGVPTVASIPSDPALAVVFQAIVDHRQVSFTYRSQERSIDPWRLDFQRGRWYLTGHDHLRGEERNFRLDRIEGLVAIGGPATTEPGGGRTTGQPSTAGRPLAAWEIGVDEPVEARVRFDADHVAIARRQLGDAVTWTEEADGGAVAGVPVSNVDAFRTFLFGFLDHAELLSPSEWRADVITWLEAIAEVEA